MPVASLLAIGRCPDDLCRALRRYMTRFTNAIRKENGLQLDNALATVVYMFSRHSLRHMTAIRSVWFVLH